MTFVIHLIAWQRQKVALGALRADAIVAAADRAVANEIWLAVRIERGRVASLLNQIRRMVTY